MNDQTRTAAHDIDPITFEVIRHKLWSINEEGSATMIHVSGSPVVHATDYNFGIYAADGEMAVIGVYLLVPIYTGYMAIKEFLGRFNDIEDGDVFIINDPYLAAEHQNDVQFCAPFFHDGKLVAWLGCMAHQVDLGGLDPGSWCPTATDVYQEGLRIPPGRIVRKGEINRELWDVIIANSRMAATVSNDFSAFLAGLKVAKQRLAELCGRYGGETVARVMQQSIEGSERELRKRLAALPDGVFEHVSFLDRPAKGGTEVLKISCKLTKTADRLAFDFDGSDPQSAAYGMATRAGTVGAVATLMLCMFGSGIAWNHGLMRPVTFVARDGLCVTATPPVPVSGGAAGANWVAMCAAAGCLAKLVSFSPEYKDLAFGPGDGSWQLAQFGGVNQYGEGFAAMYLDSLLWGGPAFSFRDGVDSGGAMVILGGGTQDVEQQEVGQPLLYLWRRELPDSGGAGRHRGGNGIEYAMTPIDTDGVTGVLASHGIKLPNRTGIFGGYPGSCARYEVVRKSDISKILAAGRSVDRLDAIGGQYEVLGSISAGVAVPRGDVVNIRLQNGGGYGDPLDREPDAALNDVRNGSVSPAMASALYGVVITDDSVDHAATAARRKEIRGKRLASMRAPRAAGRGSGRANGGTAIPWGDSLVVHGSGDDSTTVACKHCGAMLGPLKADWRDLAGVVKLTGEQLGPYVEVHDELVAEQFVCPSCAASLWVEVLSPKAPPAPDFTLAT